jgi:hypothetical protein
MREADRIEDGVASGQWRCGRPLAQPQQPPPPPPPMPQAEGSLPPAVVEAKVESFFSNRFEPQ